VLSNHLEDLLLESDSILVQYPNNISKTPYYVCKVARPGQKTIIGIMSLIDYRPLHSRIMPHEQVNKIKVNDYVNQFISRGILNNPILLFYKQFPEFQKYMNQLVYNLEPNGTYFINDALYEVYFINNFSAIIKLQNYINRLNKLYIADGHHRVYALSELYLTLSKDINPLYISFMVQENDLALGSFNRYIRGININMNILIEQLKENYLIKPVSESELELKRKIYLYLSREWYELNLKKKTYNEKFIHFPSVNVDQFIISPLISQSPFAEIIYSPNTYCANDIIQVFHQSQCQLAVHVPELSLLELYSALEESYKFPPHSTCFTPKIPNNLFIQRLNFSR